MTLPLPRFIRAQEGYSERQTTWQEERSSQRHTANPPSSQRITSAPFLLFLLSRLQGAGNHDRIDLVYQPL